MSEANGRMREGVDAVGGRSEEGVRGGGSESSRWWE